MIVQSELVSLLTLFVTCCTSLSPVPLGKQPQGWWLGWPGMLAGAGRLVIGLMLSLSFHRHGERESELCHGSHKHNRSPGNGEQRYGGNLG